MKDPLEYGKKSDWGEYTVTFSYKEKERSKVKWTVPVEDGLDSSLQRPFE